MGKFLQQSSNEDKTQAGKIMSAVGKSLAYSAHQRVKLHAPLDRIQQEVTTFRQRAITDSLNTLNRMENSRTDYRGALLWMKNISQELDPDTYKQMEKYRSVQTRVRKTKTNFDKLKIDAMQKIDLLSASRCNMLSNVLAAYQNALLVYLEKTSRTLDAVSERFKGAQFFEFSILKHLTQDCLKPTEGCSDQGGNEVGSDGASNHDAAQQTTGNTLTEEELDARLEEVFKQQFDERPSNQTTADYDDLLKGFGLGGNHPASASSAMPVQELLASTDDEPILEDHKDILSDLLISFDDDVGSNPTSSSSAATMNVSASSALPFENFSLGANQSSADGSVPSSSRLLEDDLFGDFESWKSAVLPSSSNTPPRPPSSNSASVSNSTDSVPQGSTDLGQNKDAKTTKANSDADAWINFFSDLNVLGNPDLIGRKEGNGINDA